jgi:hypothetical protein
MWSIVEQNQQKVREYKAFLVEKELETINKKVLEARRLKKSEKLVVNRLRDVSA